jgi:predicted nucleic acid-binding protein
LERKYVVDTNVIVQRLLKPDGLAAKIIESQQLELYAPHEMVDELWEHRSEWLKKNVDVDLRTFTDTLGYYVKIVHPPYDVEAVRIAKQKMGKVDPDDVAFLATAIMMKASVWTFDSDFREQDAVPVATSTDILEGCPEIPVLYQALEDEYLRHQRSKGGRGSLSR